MWEMWTDIAPVAVALIDVVPVVVSIVIWAIATEAFVEIVTASELSKIVFLTSLAKLALPLDPTKMRWYWTYLYGLFKCGYCFSVVSSLLLTLYLPVEHLPFLVQWMVVHRLSNWIHEYVTIMRKGRIAGHDVMLSAGTPIKIEVVNIDDVAPKGSSDGSAE